MTATFVDRDERPRSATVMIVEDHALLADGLADALRPPGSVRLGPATCRSMRSSTRR